MIFKSKTEPKTGIVYESVFYAVTPYKLKDGRTVWLERVWKKEVVEYWFSIGNGRLRRDRILEDMPLCEKMTDPRWTRE